MSRPKLIRDKSTPERAAFWASVKQAAEEARDVPAWVKAGIDLNPHNFETYGGEI